MKRSTALAASLMSMSALSIAGCSARQDMPLPPNITTALESAFNKGDIQACVDIYADDAEIIAEDSPAVRGRNAIEHFFIGARHAGAVSAEEIEHARTALSSAQAALLSTREKLAGVTIPPSGHALVEGLIAHCPPAQRRFFHFGMH